ncbi:MAG: hypothetical protein HWD58_07015 [Bacteroidota bacterium]|nr:MAG: hypothetical protein HWD58_07015 [Bacteroidota bacterium]
MYPFLETILQKDAQMPLLERHIERLKQTCRVHQLCLPDLTAIFDQLHEIRGTSATEKVRLFYGNGIFKIESQPYHIRSIRKLKLITNENLRYPFKSVRREVLEQLQKKPENTMRYSSFKKTFTDTSYANVACWDGATWWTPKEPLLKGVRRAALLEEGRIQEARIGPGDLFGIQK